MSLGRGIGSMIRRSCWTRTRGPYISLANSAAKLREWRGAMRAGLRWASCFVRAKFPGAADRPPVHTSDLVIYEMHVRAFTARDNSGVTSKKRGTFAGVIEKIPYLKDLGVTAVELMPVTQQDPQEGGNWGYMPLAFFAPHHGYSSADATEEILIEFRSMVKALHAAGIEVILDAVYNHTTEGWRRWPNLQLQRN